MSVEQAIVDALNGRLLADLTKAKVDVRELIEAITGDEPTAWDVESACSLARAHRELLDRMEDSEP